MWRIVLAIVALIELNLFIHHHAPGGAGTPSGEGLVIWGDGLGYYAWLRSPLVDRDFSFANEFDAHNPLGHWVPKSDTELGLRANPFSVGPACLWAIAVVPGHLLLCGLGAWGLPWPADGYSMPYQWLVGGMTLLASLVGLLFLYGICRRYARPERAALAAALLTLGTTIVYYGAVEVSMAHGLGTAVVAALVWYWLRTYGSQRPGRWLLVGALIGAAALVRWQLATFAVLPMGEALLACWPQRRAREISGTALRLALAGCAAALAFAPQMIAWRCVYGHWLVSPMPLAHHWLQPDLWAVLGSVDRSLFYWTPLALLACCGMVLGLRWAQTPSPSTPLPQGGRGEEKSPSPPTPLSQGGRKSPSPPGGERGWGEGGFSNTARAPLALLFIAFLLQVYVLASVRGSGVYPGAAYGCRQLTEALVALAPGLALLLERARGNGYRLLVALGCLLALWNLLLIRQYQIHLVPPDAGASPTILLINLLRLTHSRPSVLIVRVVGVIAIGLLLTLRRVAATRLHIRPV